MFHSARLKLTAWYLLIIMLVSIIFSLIIFGLITKEVTRFSKAQKIKIEHQFQNGTLLPPPTLRDRDRQIPIQVALLVDDNLVTEIKTRVALTLLMLNGAIFVIAGGLGYLLAGETLKPIKDMVDDQKRFITDASHELRTPLTALKTALEVTLRDKKLTLKEARLTLQQNLDDVNNLYTLVESLLALSQASVNKAYTDREKVKLHTLSQTAISKLKPLIAQKNLTVTNDFSNDQISVHKASFVELLVILLDNAIKYSPTKTTIVFSSKKSNTHISLMIHDQGYGISPNDQPHIFDRFFRADHSRSKNLGNGYGLGLSIAKKIVISHGGTITVQSNTNPKNQGTLFTIRLPLVPLS
jgi:two-component system, OmpR family, sensor histidine kinase CiaH